MGVLSSSGDGKYWTRHVSGRGNTYEHVLIAEQTLGKSLPKGVEVHHVNGNGLDPGHENLVICEDKLYHRFLHARAAGLSNVGSVDGRRCYICGNWGVIGDGSLSTYIQKKSPNGIGMSYHKSCMAKRSASNRFIRKEEM